MAGSNIRAFTVSASGVTIKNLTIKNANYGGSGGATYFSSSGTVTGCNFTKNKATGNYSYGGAVHFSGSGIVINSNFDYNIASEDGGAINMVLVLCQIVILLITLQNWMVVQFTSKIPVRRQIVILLIIRQLNLVVQFTSHMLVK